MKTVELRELLQEVCDGTYEEQYDVIMRKIQSGQLEPVKASGLNGKKPALYLKYRILSDRDGGGSDSQAAREKADRMRSELLYAMTPAIKNDYYLAHLKQYELDRKWVLLTNDYLKNQRELLGERESANERSFEIWRREKFLIKEQGPKLLKRMGIAPELLNLYETTEPLAYYSHTKNVPQNILILENKDTFYSMRRCLLGGTNRILGMEFGTLIYGAGKGILRSFRDFTICLEPYITDNANRIYYFGDLDYEGIWIYESLYRRFEEQCEIRPLTRGYKAMLEKFGSDGLLPDAKEGQNRRCGEVFFRYFTEEDRDKMLKILEAEKYIPQESLSAWDWRRNPQREEKEAPEERNTTKDGI